MTSEMTAIIPSLVSRDLEETTEFYVDTLGFERTATWPSPAKPSWCEFSRDAIRLHFHTMSVVGQPAVPVFSGTLYFRTQDILTLAREWEREIEFLWGPETMAYGWLEFGFQDPNGYVLAVSQDAKETGPMDGW
ncbi:MAG: VOC family protein [Alphaproteobacteria bacterium]|nr:VOC family protein [Alphaproteobacteria bacterium]